ncbi:MAG: tRNA (adenosine(37)-N6)-threonylcarbamoyltransferase complex transferase subunit TsaD [Candidatus Aminicenantes bacterium]|nr:tRNA (adenosine(37)-N6)-threonylcarbamoyltransferase complex transferase subunit TsaD [Candidatus Aminicenantes bacterium]
MLILAIETSCDETSAAVLRAPNGDCPRSGAVPLGGPNGDCPRSGTVPLDGRSEAPEVLSNIVLSQDEVHAPFGGVVPELASRQHLKTIAAIVGEALSRAGVGLEAVDLYAVTQGPGLIGSLLVGLSFAKGLAYYHKKPLVGVDHLEAHLEACFLENPAIEYPVLGLLVSGGHTALYLMEKPLSYKLLGKTRDDAAGEALDKIAKFLGLGYPGGPVIEKLGRGGDPKGFPFAVPRTKDRSLDFSFSGLKTAALKHIRERGISKDDPRLADFLASFEDIVARALVDNLRLAADAVLPRSLVLCGGVARNTRLRARFQDFARQAGLDAYVPSPKLCTDNAAMVGALAIKKFARLPDAATDLDLDAYPRS